MFEGLPDKLFLRLIFTSGDKLGMDYIEEVKKRRRVVIPFMCNVLLRESIIDSKIEGSGGLSTQLIYWGYWGTRRLLTPLFQLASFPIFMEFNGFGRYFPSAIFAWVRESSQGSCLI